MLVRGAQVAAHLPGLEHVRWLAASLVVRGQNGPQVLVAAQRRCSVGHRDAEHILLALRVHTDDGRGPAVGTHHLIADLHAADVAPAIRHHHLRIERLRSTSHECQRRDLDRAIRHEPLELLRLEHVVERVVERPEIRIDLLLERAGQKAETLAGLDRGPRQDDPADLLVEERAHGERNGEVRLARAGRADGEHDVVRADQVDVLLLLRALRRDRATGARREDGVAEHALDRGAAGIALEELHGAHDVIGGQCLAGERQVVELLEGALRDVDRGLVALDRDLVAAQVDLRARGALDQLEAGVVAADEGLQCLGIVECELLAPDGLGLRHDGRPRIACAHMPGTALPRLVEVMERLLGPDGCPWDKEQTLETLRPFLVEETYEVLDALARDDVAGHREELGDVMFQIVFHAAIRQREGAFDIDDVCNAISDKLIHRHPHIFAETKGIETSEQVLQQWGEIKAAEKAAKGIRTDRILSGVKPGPGLARAQKIGTKAGKVGFDWPGWQGSFGKIEEEVGEVREAIESKDQAEVHHEIGDLLLAVVNVARKVGVDAEQAMLDATLRFQRRFEFVEDRLTDRGKTPQTSTLEEMDALWNDAKKAGVK